MKQDRCPTCKRRYRRSHQANALYWTLLYAIADKVRPGGHSFSADTWHLQFKKSILGAVDTKLPNGMTLTIPNSTAELDVAEFSDYFEKVQAWAASRSVWLADLESAA